MMSHANVLTPAVLKALGILREHGPLLPRHFARLMWPDSGCWKHHTKCGPKGVSYGGGMSLAGGAFLGKLAQKGLATMTFTVGPEGWVLTKAGAAALDAMAAMAAAHDSKDR